MFACEIGEGVLFVQHEEMGWFLSLTERRLALGTNLCAVQSLGGCDVAAGRNMC